MKRTKKKFHSKVLQEDDEKLLIQVGISQCLKIIKNVSFSFNQKYLKLTYFYVKLFYGYFVLKWPEFQMRLLGLLFKHCVSRHHKERIEKAAFCSSGAMLIRSSHVSRHNSSRKTLTFCCLLCLLLPKKLTQSWTNERVTTYLMTSLSFRLWTKIDIDRLALGPELTMATFSCISFSLIFSLSFSIA